MKKYFIFLFICAIQYHSHAQIRVPIPRTLYQTDSVAFMHTFQPRFLFNQHRLDGELLLPAFFNNPEWRGAYKIFSFKIDNNGMATGLTKMIIKSVTIKKATTEHPPSYKTGYAYVVKIVFQHLPELEFNDTDFIVYWAWPYSMETALVNGNKKMAIYGNVPNPNGKSIVIKDFSETLKKWDANFLDENISSRYYVTKPVSLLFQVRKSELMQGMLSTVNWTAK